MADLAVSPSTTSGWHAAPRGAMAVAWLKKVIPLGPIAMVLAIGGEEVGAESSRQRLVGM